VGSSETPVASVMAAIQLPLRAWTMGFHLPSFALLVIIIIFNFFNVWAINTNE